MSNVPPIIHLYNLAPNGGTASWDSYDPMDDIICLGGGKRRITGLRAINTSSEAGELKLVREGLAVVFYASDGVQYAYRADGNIFGDLAVWKMFD